MLSIFCFSLLLDGNVLTLLVPKNIFNDWQPIVQHFNSNPITRGILQIIEIDDTSYLTKWWSDLRNEKRYNGLLLLLDDERRIESLFINHKCFSTNKGGWQSLIKWIRCRYQCLITMPLQEYNMNKIVT